MPQVICPPCLVQFRAQYSLYPDDDAFVRNERKIESEETTVPIHHSL